MSLSSEILANYIDGNYMVTPNPCSRTVQSGSDNAPMYTSEFYVMLYKRGEMDINGGLWALRHLIARCIDSYGMLNRVPTSQPSGLTGPDDYLGVLNACKTFVDTSIARGFLKASLRFLGCLNNENPGKWTWQSFLHRQPQITAAMIAAAFPSFLNPLHWLMRVLFFPWFLYAAGAIAISCINESIGSTDPRRLSWHLLQTTKGVSLLCYLASKIWYRRLYRDYGPDGMKAVAKIYYSPGHPFSRFWCD